MECLVDAGRFVRTRAVSPHDAADLARLELGAAAKFPIDVLEDSTGERICLFVDQVDEVDEDLPPRKPPKRTERAR